MKEFILKYKYYLIITTVVLIIILGIIIFRKSDDVTFKLKVDNEQQKFIEIGEVLTYPYSQYKTFADKIYSALFYTTFDDDEETVYKQFEMIKNNLDYLELVKNFGLRRASFSFNKYNLVEFLYKYLNNDELDQINSILFVNGVTYRV